LNDKEYFNGVEAVCTASGIYKCRVYSAIEIYGFTFVKTYFALRFSVCCMDRINQIPPSCAWHRAPVGWEPRHLTGEIWQFNRIGSSNCLPPGPFLWLMLHKHHFGWGFAPDRTGELTAGFRRGRFARGGQ